ncbi:MAG: DUF2304 domain-containing protein [Clostridia bacterium]|nr:DUF2304 domain-containing protein [Clostridia bacterium]
MSVALRTSLLIGIAIYLIIILVLLRKKRLSLKYSLLWIFTGLVFFILVLFPQIVSFLAKLFGVISPVNAVFVCLIFFILLILISLTSIVSLQQKRIKSLIQHLSLLQKQLDDKTNNK